MVKVFVLICKRISECAHTKSWVRALDFQIPEYGHKYKTTSASTYGTLVLQVFL